MKLTTTQTLINEAISSYQSGERPFGARGARTWFIKAQNGELLPLKYIIGMASQKQPVIFNTSDAISTAKEFGFNPIFTGAQLLGDLAKVQCDSTLDATTQERLILARLGQGFFRKALIAEQGKCFVTGYADHRMLVASHIKPWADSSNEERLDCNNGLLLIPQLDKAFDRGLISFSKKGMLLISPSLKNSKSLGIRDDMKLFGFVKRSTYLDYHRDKVFLGALRSGLAK